MSKHITITQFKEEMCECGFFKRVEEIIELFKQDKFVPRISDKKTPFFSDLETEGFDRHQS